MSMAHAMVVIQYNGHRFTLVLAPNEHLTFFALFITERKHFECIQIDANGEKDIGHHANKQHHQRAHPVEMMRNKIYQLR